MNRKNIFKGILFALTFIGLQSCDKDFSDVGGNIIGDGNINIETYTVENIVAYNQSYGAADTKNLVEIPLGFYENGTLGQTSSSFVVQVASNSSAFSLIGENAKIDSVYVYIPYFSEYEKTENDIAKYKLNNVYGDGSFDLKVYQNGYFLSNSNPSQGGSSKYFSNNSSIFNSNKIGNILNDSPDSKQNTNFVFTNTNIIIYKYDKDGNPIKDETTGKHQEQERLSPGLWLDLNKEYFQELFIGKKTALQDPNTFNDLFRGLYFVASGNSSKGAIGLLNIFQGQLVVKYTDEKKSTNSEGEETTTTEKKTMTFSLSSGVSSGNLDANSNINVNLYQNSNNAEYLDAISQADTKNGDDKLYIKGGEGSIAIVDLFSKNDYAELKKLREDDILINDAILTVYVDENAMSNNINPKRLYLYNYDDEVSLVDFSNDTNTNSSYLKAVFGGIFQEENKDKNLEGNLYRFRITEYLRSLIKSKDFKKSPKLALSMTNDYNSSFLNYIKNQTLESPIDNSPNDIKTIPAFSVSCPVGTVLYGANTQAEGKKMKLEIFYTKTKN
ncbi:DUF4270 domain-containing protein [Myroides indicus]|uniref:Uncharacterized protein DUF4270 n=1 Tax=Myroides indicus TaxID=1323422 RepID=A0A4R7F1A1_9FLAO|nr:DUF4270 domain-containing protein [Myroides indicus]TDS58178.1 uncharacterized protein DUF4270 [Myroides indicus]